MLIPLYRDSWRIKKYIQLFIDLNGQYSNKIYKFPLVSLDWKFVKNLGVGLISNTEGEAL